MAHIVVVGAGLGGLPTAYELRHLLPRSHKVTLISNTPKFTFIPSLPWVSLGLTPLEKIQMEIGERVTKRGINWVPESVVKLNPHTQEVHTDTQVFEYDYIVIATGAELALDAIPGLGPEGGYTQSVCNPHHALMARDAWQDFLDHPGPLVVGAVPGASCFGPAYEFALLADFVLRKRGLRDQVSITFVTPEPYAGHLGIGGMANSSQIVSECMAKRGVKVLENTAITEITPPHEIVLGNGERLPCRYSMLLPPFRGPRFVREVEGLGDAKGLLPVLPTYQHPDFPSVYSVGVVTQLSPPEQTPIPIGVPKTGQMTEAMGMAVAHNIAVKLGEIEAQPVAPTLEAICFADFGDSGILFLADPVLPDPKTGKRRRAITLSGRWVSWMKTAFEKYFLAKMRWGAAVPWPERLGLWGVGLSLVEPVPEPRAVAEKIPSH
ncbi:MAG: NAD(P)/FAD-dependent oxidoreductase [Thermosynechococcaceae cyanobacterium]